MNIQLPAWLVPQISRDGDRWCALYGTDLQEGLVGFGDSPKAAVAALGLAYHGIAPPKEEVKSTPERWATSIDGETFHTAEGATTYSEALTAALADYPGAKSFFVGKEEPPTSPEEFFDCADWLETVSCSDEYSGDYADGWDMSSKEQREELNAEVQQVMAKWLSRHHLYPTFFTVPNPIEYKTRETIEIEA